MEQYLDTWSRSRTHEGEIIPDVDAVSFALTPTGSVSGLDPATLALMIDISHWQGDVDLKRMVTEGGIAMCFPKAADGKQVRAGGAFEITNYIDDWFYRNVDKCKAAGIPCGPYFYVQPHLEDYTLPGCIDWNWKVLKAALDPLTPLVSYHAIMLDFEEKTANDTNGRDVMLALIAKIQADPKMSKVPIIIYTSNYILSLYPSLRDALSYKGSAFNLMLAQWVLNTVTTCTWDHLKTNVLPTLNFKVVTPGYAAWKAVQFSSSFILPGGSGRTDLILGNTSKANWWTWLKFTSTTPEEKPEPDDDPEITKLWLAVDALKADLEALKNTYLNHTHGKPA
jgi:GH25 family lysozyme M1 (1,4-beta-N-acetylmuramidase)